MLLSNETIWAIPDGVSVIEFSNLDEGRCFVELFNKEWEAAVESVAKEHEDCLRDNPANVMEEEDKLVVLFVPLDIPYMYGEYCDINEGCEALSRTVIKLKENCSNAKYRGCIQFAWSDSKGGDVIKFDVSSEESDEPYPLVGQILKEAVEDEEEYFWEQIEDEDDLDGVLNDFKIYKDWVGEDAIERLKSIME